MVRTPSRRPLRRSAGRGRRRRRGWRRRRGCWAWGDGSDVSVRAAIALFCRLMSRKRRRVTDEPYLVVRTSAADLGGSIGEHAHDWHQLVHVRSGLAIVRSDARTWIAPPTWAVWMPAGVRHAIRFAGATALRVVYVRADVGVGGGVGGGAGASRLPSTAGA